MGARKGLIYIFMDTVVGNKDRLALEYVQSSTDSSFGLGYLFLYVNGIRFGEDSFDFEVDAMVRHTIIHFKLDKVEFPELFECPAKELFDSFDIAWNEGVCFNVIWNEELEIEEFDGTIIPCSADKYMPNFMESFATTNDLDNCVFRYVHYAFDWCTIILIPAGKQLKLYARDDDSGQCTDVVTSFDEFIKLWQDLADKMGIDL